MLSMLIDVSAAQNRKRTEGVPEVWTSGDDEDGLYGPNDVDGSPEFFLYAE